jgi:hypothetical protein
MELIAMSEPTADPTTERIRTRPQAAIYIQHILRGQLLEWLAEWRAARDATDAGPDREELSLVVNVGERIARELRVANVALAAADSPIAADAAALNLFTGRA